MNVACVCPIGTQRLSPYNATHDSPLCLERGSLVTGYAFQAPSRTIATTAISMISRVRI